MIPSPPARRNVAPGLLLLVPAALLTLATLVIPTGQTIYRSFQRGGGTSLFGHRPAEFVGLHNYRGVLGDGAFWRAFGFSLSLAVLPLLVMVLVGPGLAAALDRAGTWPRRAGRLLLSVPLVVFSPVAIAVAWVMGQSPVKPNGVATAFGRLSDSGVDRGPFQLITTAAVFGAACGIALLIFLPVMRGRHLGRRVTPTMLAVGGIVVLAAVAVSLQAFTFGQVLTAGGPGGRTRTLAMLQYQGSFTLFDFGSGTVIATVTGLSLAVLGVVATIIAITMGLRVELPAADEARPAGRSGAGAIAGVLVLAAVVAVAVVCSWPWLSALFPGAAPRGVRPSGGRLYLNTWVPPLINAIISVGVAFPAAVGIGGLRPFGRHSEWLLLPFAPWLFVGVGPLSLAGFDNERRLAHLNTFPALISPILVSVPALVVLTLFCRGQSERRRARMAAGAPSSFFTEIVRPALPLAGLLTGAVVLLGAQSPLWPSLTATSPHDQTAPVALMVSASTFLGVGGSVGVTTPVVAVVLALIALAALQIFYLDRLVIVSGRPDEARTPWPAPPYPAWQQPPPEGAGQGTTGRS